MGSRILSLMLCSRSVHSRPFFRLRPPYTSRVEFSTASYFRRFTSAVRNDPFVKLSVSLCALIVGGTVVMELYNRLKRRTSQNVFMLPPVFGHCSVRRESVLAELSDKIVKIVSSESLPIVYVTGSSGSGKTELVRQFSNTYGLKKWLGLKSVPAMVVTVDATSQKTLHLSLCEATNRLGLQQSLSSESMFLAVVSQLISRDLPWLLVIDHLTETTQSCVDKFLKEFALVCSPQRSSGAVLITTAVPIQRNRCTLEVPQRLNENESIELLESMSGLQASQNCPLVSDLLKKLCYHPMGIALAAATIKIYSSSSHLEKNDVVEVYKDLLTESLSSHSEVLEAALTLYYEAAATDSRFRHTFDFLGSCDVSYPLPVSVIAQHLHSDIYAIPEEALAPPSIEPILANLKASDDTTGSYWSKIKSFLRPASVSDDSILKVLAASQDEVSYMRDSPILLFKSAHGNHSNFEFLYVHSVAAQKMSALFANHTVLKLDQDHIGKDIKKFEQSTWYRRLQKFDEQKSLQVFQQSLPGVSSPGVLTKAQFLKLSPNYPQSMGVAIPQPLSYGQYLHIVSHYHRALASFSSYLQSCKGEMEGTLMQQCLEPHLQAMKAFPLTSHADSLLAEIMLVTIQSLSSSLEDRLAFVTAYEELIASQKQLLGMRCSAVASSMVDLAMLHLSINNSTAAVNLLEAALVFYKELPSKVVHSQLALDMSLALSSLGLAYGQLGRKKESSALYEQALAAAQSVPPSGKVSVRQQRLIAGLLVDVSNAHLALGDLEVAKKYCELALVMLQTVYPEGHRETIRLFHINSIVSALLGNREESARLRTEASKLDSKLLH